MYNTVIIGGGCSSLTAAIYAGRAELKPLVFVGDIANRGGLLSKTSIVENYPGYPSGINGFELVNKMEQQAVLSGATIKELKIINVDTSKRPFKVIDENGNEYLTKTIIIATGSYPNKLNLPNEDNLWGNGISSCAVCDGVLYKKKRIIVIGGGDSSMEHALFLTKFSNVTLIHRQNKFRASKLMQTRVIENPKINIIFDTIVTELHGDTKLTGITIKNILTNETNFLPVDGLFYGLGLNPNTNIFNVAKNSNGYILTNQGTNTNITTMTSVEGIFVAGDAHDDIYRQAIVACGEGCKAAIDVHKYLEDNHW
jgi:thioredoxin reductase (NADPH)